MKERWQQLSSREQQLVILMTIVVSITLFYFLFWSPLQQGIDDGKTRYQAQTSALMKMQKQAAEAKSLRASGGTSTSRIKSSSSLLGLIERTAQQNKLKSALQKVQPDGKDGARVWMDNAPFDQVIQWLSVMGTRHGIIISEITFERQEDPGRVNSRILLRANP
ncbi:MAG: type II secretion system protein M [Gammaproteobacteria bacterium]|nr:type II secretion system protein M [Gammaproteobacteria bacterium]